MKKITLLLTLMIASFGFGQELLTNGDFEAGVSPWVGSAANVVTEGGNSYNSANVTVAGNPWDANLSQVLTITSGTAYKLTFDAWSDTTRPIIVGIGLNQDPWTNTTDTANLTTTSQSFEFSFVGPATSDNSRVIFDMGANTGFVGIDNVSLIEIPNTCGNGVMDGDETGVDCGGSLCTDCVNEPTTAPSTPPGRAASDVVSIYGEAYGTALGLSGVDWDNGSNASEETYDSNPVLKITNGSGDFIGFDINTVIDATSMTHVHADFWVPGDYVAGQVLKVKLSNHDNEDGSAGESNAIIKEITLAEADIEKWVSLDLELGDDARAKLKQLLLIYTNSAGAPSVVYVDNIYLHNNTETTMSTASFTAGQFEVYPNPTQNVWNIKATQAITAIQVYDVLGKKVLANNYDATRVELNASSLKSGLYFAKVNTAQGVQTLKLVKK